MDISQKLEAIEEIRKVRARYCRFVDTKQWDALKDLFIEDATFDGGSAGMGPIANREEFVANAANGLAGCVSVHHCHCPEIELISDSSATSIWAMEDMLQWSEDSGSPIRTLHGMGHYHETFTKIDGHWKIASWKITRLRVDSVTA
ncbi:nuclear transport factor 2 family protein [Sphingobium sp. HBC34]|uniref:Nuclear transport factor 2 family protein n=1 Tax=Sphingobium cyanobacteriorum TaxID=3063954 RepID=A0ABT8ZP72_9SPHN|nr:nuclear transport factor 2 family protein [Sphingobium sp. HBC34]MDO7836340.1 nuclear transport factor 2 family protein [Sphingobium sp. HBC34]